MATKKPTTLAAEKLDQILTNMGLSAKVTVTGDDPPMLEIEVDDPGLLIGTRGDGIRSLQHLLRMLLLKEGEDLAVLIDIDGYREKKEQQLSELAKRKAEQVKASGRLEVLSPMSSYERRLVHIAIRDDDGVVTESLGEGKDRRVMIKKAE